MKKTCSEKKTAKKANKMWGGHFSVGPAQAMARINACIEADKRLGMEDVEGSMAHARMLGAQGIVSQKDMRAILKGLEQIADEMEKGRFVFSEELEDVHMNVESRLAEIVGDAAGRLHTARSRNDQVATDMRLWTRAAILRAQTKLLDLMKALAEKALAHADTVMPGFTHLQPAQPITFGHHLLAYVEMFARDATRFFDALERMNYSPLGAAALAGTSFPIDRAATAKNLGFDGAMANSIDAVSDRDFAMEYLATANIAGVHLSRLAEEMILWSSDGFRFVSLSEHFTTGSSIMPQKRNPDAAELVRAKAAGLIGLNVHLLTLMKGLPLAYNKDMQDSKPPVMKAADELEMALDASSGMVCDMTVNEKNMEAATRGGFLTATDLADWLTRELKMPFRKAHHVTGRIVALAEKKGVRLDELPLEDMQTAEPGVTRDVFSVLSVQNSVKSRTSFGGTAPQNVRAQARQWLKALQEAQ